MDRHPFRLAVEPTTSTPSTLLHETSSSARRRCTAPTTAAGGRAPAAPRQGDARGLTYIDELHGEGTVALVFTARVGDKDVEGLDHLTLDEDGRITRFRVMIRPLSGLIAVAQTMGARLEDDPVPTRPDGRRLVVGPG
jgi:hypothetical protein